MNRTRRRGFASIVLIVLIAICGLLIYVIFFAPHPHAGEWPPAACKGNLKQIGAAATLYENTHGTLPNEDGLAFLEALYDQGRGIGINAEIFVCPSSNETPALPGHSLQADNVSYLGYRNRTDPLPIDGLARNGSRVPIAAERQAHHWDDRSYMVLFWDGHVETIDKEVFENEVQTSGFMAGKTMRSVLSD